MRDSLIVCRRNSSSPLLAALVFINLKLGAYPDVAL
jgi:hypothetical protein